MGAWAKYEFGATTLPPRAYLFAGTSSRDKIDAVVSSFGKVLFHRHDTYERYLLTGRDATVMFQLYGAPIVCDLVTVLKDGDVKEAVFFGYAYGIADGMRVGDLVVPSQVQTLDGVTTRLGAGTYTAPNVEMTEIISGVLQRSQLPFLSGKTVSVPATFWHGDESQIDPDAVALELEFAAFCHCARTAGIKAGGLFVISDTRQQRMLDKGIHRDPRMIEAFRAIRDQWQ